eukprot:scaffold10767_cov65-Cyclotella_meneghiniana.AAC.14
MRQVVRPQPFNVRITFIFLLVTSVTLLGCPQQQKKGYPSRGKESKGIWRNSGKAEVLATIVAPIIHL